MIKEIALDFKEYRIWFQNWLFYWRHSIKMSLAIKLADIKQKAFNKRYFIMLLELSAGDKLVSINNKEFDKCKRKGWLPKRMTMLELERESFYQTALSRNNKVSSKDRKAAKERYLKYAKKYLRAG